MINHFENVEYFHNSILASSLNAKLTQQKSVASSAISWGFRANFLTYRTGKSLKSEYFKFAWLKMHEFRLGVVKSLKGEITLRLHRYPVDLTGQSLTDQPIVVAMNIKGSRKRPQLMLLKPQYDHVTIGWEVTDIFLPKLEECRRWAFNCSFRLQDFESLEFTKITRMRISDPLPPVDELGEDLWVLYNSSKFSDFCFISNTGSYKVHLAILAARCPKFAQMVEETSEYYKPDSGVFTDIFYPMEFLHYIYTGQMDELEEFYMTDLYKTAARYDLHSLKYQCSDFILKHIKLANVLEVYKTASEFSDIILKEKAQMYFINNFISVMRSSEWMDFIVFYPELAGELVTKTYRELMADIHSGSLEWYFSQRRPQQEFGNNLIQQHRFSNHGGHNVEEHNIPGHILFDLDLLRAEDRDMDIGIDQQQEGRLEDNPAYEDIEIDGVNEEMDVEEE